MAVWYQVKLAGSYAAYGLSSDTKPVSPPDNCLFTEMDTGTQFHSSAGSWIQIPSGGSGASGTTTVNFGAYPGSSDTSVTVTGQAGIVSGSFVQAHKCLVATADHSADEHWVEEMDIEAGNIVAGTGFTVYAKTRNKPLYGQWTVAWSWI